MQLWRQYGDGMIPAVALSLYQEVSNKVVKNVNISKNGTFSGLAIFQKPIYWPSGAGYTWQMTSLHKQE